MIAKLEGHKALHNKIKNKNRTPKNNESNNESTTTTELALLWFHVIIRILSVVGLRYHS